MPSLPSGVTTCSVTYGKAFGFRTDIQSAGTIEVVLTCDRTIVHTVSGWSFSSARETITSGDDGMITFSVPHVDQAGFQDRSGSSITGWEYTITGFVRFPSGVAQPINQSFQVFVGQTVIDLDLVPDGPSTTPVLSPTEYVTSVDGQTGAVSLTDSYAATDGYGGVAVYGDYANDPDTLGGLRIVVPGEDKMASGTVVLPTHDDNGGDPIWDGLRVFSWSNDDGSYQEILSFRNGTWRVGGNNLNVSGHGHFDQTVSIGPFILGLNGNGAPPNTLAADDGSELPIGQQYVDNAATGGHVLYIKVALTGGSRWRLIT